MKKIISLSIIILIIIQLTSCKTADILTGQEVPNKEWDLIEESVKNSEVNMYCTYLDDGLKEWLNNKFTKELLEQHNITLNIKVLNIEDIVALLESEILDEVKEGKVDLLLLKNNEFTVLKTKNFLYEKIAEKVPNLENYINHLDIEINSEHGTSLEGLGIPFGREQLVLVFDEDELETYPHNTDELTVFLKDNKNTFTYPNPLKDKTGAEFIRTIIYERVGSEMFLELIKSKSMISKEELYEKIKPGIDYLIELDKYILKNEGEYFVRLTDINRYFKDGELYFSMNSDFANIEQNIVDEIYPYGGRAFIFEKGSIGDTTYLVIPTNAKNKTGGLVAINELLSIDMQVSKYTPSGGGNLPVIDLNLLSEFNFEKFEKVPVKRNTLTAEELLIARYPELPIYMQEMINELWDEYVNN